MKHLLALLALLFASASTAQELRYTPPTPDDFAWQWPLSLEPGQDLGRLTLKPDVYARLWRDDLQDIAAFNADGEPIPIMLVDAAFGRSTVTPPALDAIEAPLFRVPRADGRAAADQLRVRLARREGTVEIEQGLPAVPASGPQDIVLDLSALNASVTALSIEFEAGTTGLNARADVAGSSNLSDWQPLTRAQALVALDEDGLRLERRRIEFAATALPYLRIRRTDRDDPLPIHAVKLHRTTGNSGWPASEAAITTPHLAQSHEAPGVFVYAAAGPFPVDRIEVNLADRNAAATVIVESRARADLPWRERARGSVFRIGEGKRAVESSPFQTSTLRDRHWRVRTEPAQAKTPSLLLHYRADQFIFAAQGNPPYKLAVGSARAQRDNYPLHRVFSETLKAEGEHWLPAEANLGHGAELAGGAALAPRPDTSGAPTPWQWLLWLLLLASAFAVVTMVLKLLRQSGA